VFQIICNVIVVYNYMYYLLKLVTTIQYIYLDWSPKDTRIYWIVLY